MSGWLTKNDRFSPAVLQKAQDCHLSPESDCWFNPRFTCSLNYTYLALLCELGLAYITNTRHTHYIRKVSLRLWQRKIADNYHHFLTMGLFRNVTLVLSDWTSFPSGLGAEDDLRLEEVFVQRVSCHPCLGYASWPHGGSVPHIAQSLLGTPTPLNLLLIQTCTCPMLLLSLY